MCKFIGKLLFVLIFLGSAHIKIQDPAPFSALLVDRYERFQNLSQKHNFEILTSYISLDSLKVHADQINKLVGFAQIVISLAIVFNIPYVSLFFSLFLISTITIIHNPLYFDDREEFLVELGNVVLELGMVGVSLMFCSNQTHQNVDVEDAKKKPKRKPKETEEKAVNNQNDGKKKKREESAGKSDDSKKKNYKNKH